MNLHSKYIVVHVPAIDMETVIIFPECVNHADALDKHQLRPISAGYFRRTEDGKIVTEDRSTSLNLGPRPEDAALIAESLCLMGVTK